MIHINNKSNNTNTDNNRQQAKPLLTTRVINSLPVVRSVWGLGWGAYDSAKEYSVFRYGIDTIEGAAQPLVNRYKAIDNFASDQVDKISEFVPSPTNLLKTAAYPVGYAYGMALGTMNAVENSVEGTRLEGAVERAYDLAGNVVDGLLPSQGGEQEDKSKPVLYRKNPIRRIGNRVTPRSILALPGNSFRYAFKLSKDLTTAAVTKSIDYSIVYMWGGVGRSFRIAERAFNMAMRYDLTRNIIQSPVPLFYALTDHYDVTKRARHDGALLANFAMELMLVQLDTLHQMADGRLPHTAEAVERLSMSVYNIQQYLDSLKKKKTSLPYEEEQDQSEEEESLQRKSVEKKSVARPVANSWVTVVRGGNKRSNNSKLASLAEEVVEEAKDVTEGVKDLLAEKKEEVKDLLAEKKEEVKDLLVEKKEEIVAKGEEVLKSVEQTLAGKKQEVKKAVEGAKEVLDMNNPFSTLLAAPKKSHHHKNHKKEQEEVSEEDLKKEEEEKEQKKEEERQFKLRVEENARKAQEKWEREERQAAAAKKRHDKEVEVRRLEREAEKKRKAAEEEREERERKVQKDLLQRKREKARLEKEAAEAKAKEEEEIFQRDLVRLQQHQKEAAVRERRAQVEKQVAELLRLRAEHEKVEEEERKREQEERERLEIGLQLAREQEAEEAEARKEAELEAKAVEEKKAAQREEKAVAELAEKAKARKEAEERKIEAAKTRKEEAKEVKKENMMLEQVGGKKLVDDHTNWTVAGKADGPWETVTSKHATHRSAASVTSSAPLTDADNTPSDVAHNTYIALEKTPAPAVAPNAMV